MRVANATRQSTGVRWQACVLGLCPGTYALCLGQRPPEFGLDPRAGHEIGGTRWRVESHILGQDQVIALMDEATVMKQVLTILERRAAGRRNRIEPDLA